MDALLVKWGRLIYAAGKKLRVYDFDETLALAGGTITVRTVDGDTVEMDSNTFSNFRPREGDVLDFTEFNHVNNPHKIKKNWEQFVKDAKDPDTDVAILTARAAGAESSLSDFLADEGVGDVTLKALGSSDPYDKARWIETAIKKGGYDDIAFFDDSEKNYAAVTEYARDFEAGKKGNAVKFTTENPHPPKEDDKAAFDGPPVKKVYKSKNPKAAVVTYKAKPTDAPHVHSKWWDNQTDDFKQKYCESHESSQLCKKGSRRAVVAAKDANGEYKKQVAARAEKCKNKKVLGYMPSFNDKLDQLGDMAGHWLDQLESSSKKGAIKATGLFEGFTSADFDEMHEVLFGHKQKTSKEASSTDLVAKWGRTLI